VKKAIILDCNYICHVVFHSVPPLSFQHKYTQVIFGFMKRLLVLATEFPSHTFVFVWDSKYSVRREIYPLYKQQRVKVGRESTDQEKHSKRIAHLQFDEIRETVLPALGFTNNHIQIGYEGDDLMASIVHNNEEYDFIIVTTDKDMYQLIGDNCKIYNHTTKVFKTVKTFEDEYGCSPSLWAEAKSIAGCSTDNVFGVKGVAEPTAIKYLLGRMNPKTKKFKAIEASGDMIIENRELVTLPMYGTKKIKIDDNDNISRQSFVKICEKYNFKSLLTKKHLEAWDRIKTVSTC